ncbi:MAG: MotA/TolQ/ExbB proton channel family protein [Sphingomonadaceae bacterium]|jgi:biopolymer transport protein ExbB/TolQ
MTPIDHIRELLHIVAGLLIWPVLLALLALTLATIIALGATLREAFDRWRGKRRAVARGEAWLEAALDGPSDEATDIRLERALQDSERRLWQSPTRLKLAVRVGPALGLMGTLIPMAYALQGLATGDLPALASNLVTAFAATVIGLAVSILAYLMAAARENWARADSQALAFHAETLLRREGKSA